MSEPHDVVKLLLARMESHPEEFRLKDPSYHDRWYNYISAIRACGNETDKAALAVKVRDIRMGAIHEEVMEELLNGEARRRKEQEDDDYERRLAHAARQQSYQQQALQQSYKNTTSPVPIAIGGTSAMSDGSLINAGKKALKL